jgi:leucyl aminopeptidase
MQIRFAAERPQGAYALALPVAGPGGADPRLPGGSAGLVEAALRQQRFEGEPSSIAEVFVPEASGARRVLLTGLGTGTPDAGALEKVGAALAGRLLRSGETTLVVDVTGLGLDGDGAARIALGAALRSYRFDAYRTTLKDKQKVSLAEVVVVGGGSDASARWEARYAPVIAGTSFTRDLVTEPANVLFPVSFVERCERMRDLGVEIEVLEPADMERLGMHALLSVAQGSAQPARLICMRWNGGAEGERPVAFVGKGVTFDTGGISIKPAAGMEMMKWDMGGAGAVAGAMMTLAARKARANVIGVCTLAENMPSGTATRPGDVVTSMSGQTIEVINTDAEGRMVLADAMTWVQRTHNPHTVVDLATLTGAMIIALGHEYGGLFSNDDTLAAGLDAAGRSVGERLWRFPLGDAYNRQMDSPIADMKNAGPREGGSIMAACFLERFVEAGTKWAHLDIAGTVWANKATPLFDKGATAFGVRLIDQFVESEFER